MKVEGSPSCESCRSAPSTVYCRADAAALCAACDASIHSANLLARRHQRVPVLPALAGGGLVVRPSLTLPYHIGVPVGLDESEREDDEEEEAASWLMLDPVKGNGQGAAALLPFAEVDEFLDLVGYNAGKNQGSECCNGPMQQQQLQLQYSHEKSEESECLVPNELHQHQQSLQMEHGASNGLNYSVSLSSMDASVVPDTSNTSHVRASKGTIHLFSGHHPVPPRFDPMDREARVMRYREKRKARKFEKTVRYASRKAYAETRPRIKGRFAKKSDAELEVDHMFSAAVLADSSFGVVPSF